jgi:bis(5'-nucleosidyl)-tetraphosphatase
VARSEHSAGVVVYMGEPREFLLLHYPSGHWDFPKGHVEAGETDLQAALREVQEETGIRTVEVHPGFLHTFEYYYKREGTTMRKSVSYFVGRVTAKEVQVSHEHRGFVWLPYEKAIERITYRNAKDLLEKAEKFVADLKTSRGKA